MSSYLQYLESTHDKDWSNIEVFDDGWAYGLRFSHVLFFKYTDIDSSLNGIGEACFKATYYKTFPTGVFVYQWNSVITDDSDHPDASNQDLIDRISVNYFGDVCHTFEFIIEGMYYHWWESPNWAW